MATKQKSFISRDKWTKRGAIVGGIWGLVTGTLYAWGIYAAAFRGYSAIGHLFSNKGLVIKFVYLPAYLTDQVLGIFENQLNSFFSSLLGGYGPILWVLIFILFFVGMPLFIGSVIGFLVAAIVKKGVIK